MTGPVRLPQGGEIDRAQRLDFTFDGAAYSGFAGDTLASALLANGVRVVGRSFKYHRPRGIFSAGAEEPNAILDLRHGPHHDPNARATLEPLAAGMALKSIHASGTAKQDRLAFLDLFARFIPAAFYYKTFMWPNWRLYEDRIRAMAGLGRLDPAARATGAAHYHQHTDLCIIGAGPAGLTAALSGLRQGRRVLLIDEGTQLGGSLLSRATEIDGVSAKDWIAASERELIAGGAQILKRSTAVGLYDHLSVLVVEKGVASSGNGERIRLVRAKQIVIAAGAIERPLLFGNNDRPGVMLAGAALTYLRRYALRPGAEAIVATNNDSAYELASALREAGSKVCVIDSRTDSGASSPGHDAARAAGIAVHAGVTIETVLGKDVVEGVRLSNGVTLSADLVAQSGGWTPSLHLYCHAKGKPLWNSEAAAFLPGVDLPGISVIGAAGGIWALDRILQQASSRVGGAAAHVPSTVVKAARWAATPQAPQSASTDGRPKARIWVDLQNDVTTKDIALAAGENFVAVEHLKRYTTLGMATDQGKTSNINGLAVLAAQTGRDIGAIGVTTFRPPYVPVSMASIAGTERGEQQAPIRRLPAENAHRREGAQFRDYGGCLRPAWYGADSSAVTRECLAARSQAAVFDASSLGKIEVLGPAAAALLDFVYYTPMSSLKPGRLRYGLSLSETGLVADDGVVLRLAPEHFVVSCSSSHVAAMVGQLEAWRQDHFDLKSVFIHDATPHWATIAISGPQAKRVMTELDLGIDLDDGTLPHMAAVSGIFAGRPARIARVSFTGERSYEISVPAGLAETLWDRARAAGAVPLGIEALNILRAEKGYIYVGQDTDGETMPHDLGMSGPRNKRQDSYVGDRSLFTPAAQAAGRKQLVGIAVTDREKLPTGAHAIDVKDGRKRSLGYVTSSYFSPVLGHPIALGLIENGLSRLGEEVSFEHLGQKRSGKIVSTCFLDPEGARLNV
ncbi:MAG TPA: 2Fe-2S iron-sulfur cluster-binding protein [Dongiaceae bacterium]|nr:2Fe-2S iron-sulfur cluster-binding protein [Dongiaceae bacterium]